MFEAGGKCASGEQLRFIACMGFAEVVSLIKKVQKPFFSVLHLYLISCHAVYCLLKTLSSVVQGSTCRFSALLQDFLRCGMSKICQKFCLVFTVAHVAWL